MEARLFLVVAAVVAAFKSLSGSSLTTVAGFLGKQMEA